MGIAVYASIDEFVGKITYEGGIDEAIEYGLKSEDLIDTPETRSFRLDWTELRERFKIWDEAREAFYHKYLEGRGGW